VRFSYMIVGLMTESYTIFKRHFVYAQFFNKTRNM